MCSFKESNKRNYCRELRVVVIAALLGANAILAGCGTIKCDGTQLVNGEPPLGCASQGCVWTDGSWVCTPRLEEGEHTIITHVNFGGYVVRTCPADENNEITEPGRCEFVNSTVTYPSV